jgi:hypothetical protein
VCVCVGVSVGVRRVLLIRYFSTCSLDILVPEDACCSLDILVREARYLSSSNSMRELLLKYLASGTKISAATQISSFRY